MKTLTIEHVLVNYIHTPRTSAKETQVAPGDGEDREGGAQAAETLIQIEHGELTHSEFGFINEAAKPPYRVFLSNGTLYLENISNHSASGCAVVRLTGAFMGTGDTVTSGTFRPEKKSPDFDRTSRSNARRRARWVTLSPAYGNLPR